MIPILYEPNETAFTSNGICRLRDCISCVVTEGRNDVYEVDFSYPVTGANYDKITLGRIIGVTHDDSKDIQPFDIISYEKPIDGVVTFHGVHISYRQSKMTVKTVKGVDDLATALAQIKNVAIPENPFEYETDMHSTGYCGCFDYTPRSVRQILGGVEGSILDTYGGEYEWDKFTVRLLSARGVKRDFTIRYGVNLVDYNEETDYSNSYTSVIPFWKGQDDSGNEVIVIGDVIEARGEPYNGIEACVPLDLSERFESKPSKASLESVANGLVVRKNPFLPAQSISVDFISLRDTNEYAQFEKLMECHLCDIINVAFEDKVNSYKIVKTVYDVLSDRYNSLELGDLETSLADLMSDDQTSSMGIDGLPVYGTCDTSKSVAAKTATVSQGFILRTGAVVFIKFANANTVANPTLNVNSSGAIAIKRYGTTNPSTSAASSWNAGSVVALVYDGTYWQMVGWLNTTYSSMTSAEATAGTSTSSRLITPARLKEGILAHATPSNIGALPSPSAGGVSEMGQYIDLHATGGAADYDVRLATNAAANTGEGFLHINGQPIKDFVIATETKTTTGLATSWTVRKWNSGYCEAFTTTNSTGYPMTSQYTNGYYYAATQALPTSLFTSVDYGQVDRCGGSSASGLITASLYNISTTQIQWYAFNTKSETVNCSFAIRIVGKWK